MIYKCATKRDGVKFYEDNGNAMLSWLYEFYQKHEDYLPPEYRCEEDENQKRLIIDYLAGMMDEYVKTTYNHLQTLINYEVTENNK